MTERRLNTCLSLHARKDITDLLDLLQLLLNNYESKKYFGHFNTFS